MEKDKEEYGCRADDIEEFIKKNYEPVEDKPGYVWFSKRNFQIISIENLAASLREEWIKRINASIKRNQYD